MHALGLENILSELKGGVQRSSRLSFDIVLWRLEQFYGRNLSPSTTTYRYQGTRKSHISRSDSVQFDMEISQMFSPDISFGIREVGPSDKMRECKSWFIFVTAKSYPTLSAPVAGFFVEATIPQFFSDFLGPAH